MKKSLVLAMAMALGVTASAYAANPFSDVPAGHWAYDSVNKLAAAGVIEGYGDTTFGGDKLMTRYEMAQIVAKAMARGANVDKLAAEFADELDTLGVRVANLEKKADNVKITGQIRYHYADKSNDLNSHASVLRTRLWIAGQVNEDWTYTAMLQNQQDLTNDSGDETTDFQRAYVDGKLGGVKVRAGRYNFTSFDGGYLYDNRVDGVQLSYGKDVKIVGGVAKLDPKGNTRSDRAYYADLSGKIGKLGAHASYYRADDPKVLSGGSAADGTANGAIKGEDKIWGLGLNYNFGDVQLGAEYLNADVDGDYNGDDDGFIISLNYKGAKASKPGSWGAKAAYFDLGYGTDIANGFNADLSKYNAATEGYKGYSLAANYTFAKNIVGGIEWYSLEAKEGTQDNDTLWAQLIFTF